jgi:hypothetical protein
MERNFWKVGEREIEVVKRVGRKKDEASDRDGKEEEIMNGMNWKGKTEGNEKEFKKDLCKGERGGQV